MSANGQAIKRNLNGYFEYKKSQIQSQPGKWAVRGWVKQRYMWQIIIDFEPNDGEMGALVGVNCQHCLQRLSEDEQVPMGTLCKFCEKETEFYSRPIEGIQYAI